jgi:hypothetical protein
MSNQKLFEKHTDKHANHQMCIQRVVGNGIVHMGLFCKECKTDNWITWLTTTEANRYKKKFKLKQLPTRVIQ